MVPAHTIIIRKAGGFFSVCIEPPCPGVNPRVFGDIRSARGFAGGIRMTTGFPKLDLTEEAGNA